MSDPFVALMRRYVIDYTNSHDLSVCDDIMEPDYIVHIAGMSLVRDAAYKPAVQMVFAQFPGLCLAIHEIVTNGERLAMRFTEHAADTEGKLCCWAGIALYRWNGTKLTECRVEQDFLSQRRQLASRGADPLEPPHHDPWTTTLPIAASAAAEAAVREWLRNGNLARAKSGRIDEKLLASFEPVLEATDVEMLDLFSAGPRVAFHGRLRGSYRGGLPDCDAARGKETHMELAGIAEVASGEIGDVKIVTNRLGAWSRLSGQPMF